MVRKVFLVIFVSFLVGCESSSPCTDCVPQGFNKKNYDVDDSSTSVYFNPADIGKKTVNDKAVEAEDSAQPSGFGKRMNDDDIY